MNDADEKLVPDDLIPHRNLPPLRYRDMPKPINWRAMIGPSIILAGLALGSGEFILWPYITYKAGFIFFWACLLGVLTQFFLNMEIARWTLLTGESAITGFCRLSRQWAWVFLVLNIVPWMWPGWATGAGQILSWMIFGAEEIRSTTLQQPTSSDVPSAVADRLTVSDDGVTIQWTGAMSNGDRDLLVAAGGDWEVIAEELFTPEAVNYRAPYVALFGIAGLLGVGVILTAGPVVYNTVERIQMWLVGAIFLLVIGLSIVVVRPYAVTAMLEGSVNLGGMPAEGTGLTLVTLLGALAFAGAGGTTNLGQSNYVKDKGYGMGAYIGRITSPITGQPEPTSEIGYHFEHTPDNVQRWNQWWKSANVEHFFSFFITCVACLSLLSLISYSLFYTPEGTLVPGVERFGTGMNFIWGQASLLADRYGMLVRGTFMIMGVAILLTTEFGVLDTVARISTDIVKVNYLAGSSFWTLSRLYYVFLWGEILIGCVILLAGVSQPLVLITTSAALNGAVMMIYSLLLLYLNSKILSRSLSLSPVRFVAMVWSCAFFGYFTIQATKYQVIPWLTQALSG